MFAYRRFQVFQRNLIKFPRCFLFFSKTETTVFQNEAKKFTKQLDIKLKKKTAKLRASKDIEKTVKHTYGYFVDSTEYFNIRRQAVDYLKLCGVSPYPHEFRVTISLKDFVDRYGNLEISRVVKDDLFSIAGRVMSKRKSSSKLIFYDLKQEGVKIQVVADASYFSSEQEFLEVNQKIRRGDVIGCKGYPYKSDTGELSIKPTYIQTLAPCLHAFPHPYFGLKNIPEKLYQRYLNLITDDSVRQKLTMRKEVIKYIRNFFYKLNFIEVETPYLNMISNITDNKSFKTYHKKLDLNLNLRITSGFCLKELIIGGFNKIFEIGRFFNNEETNETQSCEFTACEFYMTHKNLDCLMKFMELLISESVRSLNGSYKIKCPLDSATGPQYEIDFTPPFKRVKMWPFLEAALKMKLPDPITLNSLESNKVLLDICAKHEIDCPAPQSSSKLLNQLIEHFIEKTIVNPTFVCDYPIIMSLFAKQHPNICGLCERFELFTRKMKVVDSYAVLNDPVQQRNRFQNWLVDRVNNVAEVSMMDETYFSALEYGLPPTVGGRIYIDKLVMILTSCKDIREILWFPLEKPKKSGE